MLVNQLNLYKETHTYMPERGAHCTSYIRRYYDI